MAARRTQRGPKKKRKSAPPNKGIQGVELEPIRVVKRELTRPDGTRVTVEVPVYPPFRLPDRAAEAEARRKRSEKKAG